MHWADVLAKELAARGSRHVIATAITPSGPIHVGNLREVLTADAVHRAVTDLGCDCELVYIADSYDPLRKVYPFLDAATYAEHVGKPLCDIPCPCGSHASYAEHFLEPFFAALAELGVHPRVLRAHEMYREGQYLEATKTAMDSAARIRDVMLTVAKREGKLPQNWIPFNIQCERCGRLNAPVPTLYEYPYIEYACSAIDKAGHQLGCGHEGRKDVRTPGGGKLPWRVDWPARWSFLDVTFEAFGKDHAAAGSSWDTGQVIARDVYGIEPPLHTVYEFVQVKGVGAMHSSTGTAVSSTEMLAMTPPEVLRFLFLRYEPGKHIDFETGTWILDLVETYDRWERAFHTGGEAARNDPQFKEIDRVYELSQPDGKVPPRLPAQVPYSHLVLLAQLAPDWAGVRSVLRRSEAVDDLDADDERRLRERVRHARYWLDRFAPEDARTSVQVALPPTAARLGPNERRFLASLRQALGDARWTGQAIHDAVHGTSKEAGLRGSDAFRAIYVAFLGKERGPRAGHLLASLERDFVLKRLEEASA
ncbi:MAG TPA: lysine--tRNA ligase [Candidatus Thermoplasmatota archaeon]|nr:lysine--tRNA ligase [Candidatus Thermoplasmatota archaeon]